MKERSEAEIARRKRYKQRRRERIMAEGKTPHYRGGDRRYRDQKAAERAQAAGKPGEVKPQNSCADKVSASSQSAPASPETKESTATKENTTAQDAAAGVFGPLSEYVADVLGRKNPDSRGQGKRPAFLRSTARKVAQAVASGVVDENYAADLLRGGMILAADAVERGHIRDYASAMKVIVASGGLNVSYLKEETNRRRLKLQEEVAKSKVPEHLHLHVHAITDDDRRVAALAAISAELAKRTITGSVGRAGDDSGDSASGARDTIDAAGTGEQGSGGS